MSCEFQSTLYPTVRSMADAIAYQWYTSSGTNDPATVSTMIGSARTDAGECIKWWDLNKKWMDKRDATKADIIDAFQRFIVDRPDRAA